MKTRMRPLLTHCVDKYLRVCQHTPLARLKRNRHSLMRMQNGITPMDENLAISCKILYASYHLLWQFHLRNVPKDISAKIWKNYLRKLWAAALPITAKEQPKCRELAGKACRECVLYGCKKQTNKKKTRSIAWRDCNILKYKKARQRRVMCYDVSSEGGDVNVYIRVCMCIIKTWLVMYSEREETGWKWQEL